MRRVFVPLCLCVVTVGFGACIMGAAENTAVEGVAFELDRGLAVRRRSGQRDNLKAF